MEEINKELLTYFMYLKSIELDPDKYGSLGSIEEWSNAIKENKSDADLIIAAASELSEQDWESLNKQYMELQEKKEQDLIQSAAKGARLKELKEQKNTVPAAKKGMPIPKKKKKKCSCGCDMLVSKAAGGKLTEVCACKCGGKMKKSKKK